MSEETSKTKPIIITPDSSTADLLRALLEREKGRKIVVRGSQ